MLALHALLRHQSANQTAFEIAYATNEQEHESHAHIQSDKN